MTKRHQISWQIGMALAVGLTVGMFLGCGGDGAKPAKAGAVVVTYYYLPL